MDTTDNKPTIVGNMLETAGTGVINSALGAVTGLLLGNYNDKRQLKQQTKLQDLQIKGQKELTDYNQMKAMEMWENTNYSAQREQLEKAGLSVGMMYGKGGAGGQSTGVTAGSVGSGTAPSGGGEIGMGIQQAMQLAMLKAQKENIEADTKNKLADAENKNTGRPLINENLRQSGIEIWTRNQITKWLNESHELDKYIDENGNEVVNVNKLYNDIYKSSLQLDENSTNLKQLNATLLKTITEEKGIQANIDLTNKKALGYWQELLNATTQANNDTIKAMAIKLATEWGTGEYTNWKTWAELGKDALGLIKDLIPTPAKMTTISPTTIIKNAK